MRSTLREQESLRFRQQVFDGSLDQLVLSMLKAERADSELLDELDELIKDARKKKKRK